MAMPIKTRMKGFRRRAERRAKLVVARRCLVRCHDDAVVGGFPETLRRSWPLAEAGPFWRPSVETLFHRLC